MSTEVNSEIKKKLDKFEKLAREKIKGKQPAVEKAEHSTQIKKEKAALKKKLDEEFKVDEEE